MSSAFEPARVLDLHGRVAVVTGAGRGIGAGIARLLAASGARIWIGDVESESAQAVAGEIVAAGGHCKVQTLDVSDTASIAALRDAMTAAGDEPSILVNNAGVSGELPLEDPGVSALWQRQIAVNLTGTFEMCRAFAPALARTRGVIVNLASASSFNAVTRSFSYIASKGGIRSLTQVLAKELAASGIRVNAVAPGGIDTPLMARRKQDSVWMNAFYQRTPMRRLGTPEDVAKVVLFLVSPLADYVTGVTLPVDGGFLAT